MEPNHITESNNGQPDTIRSDLNQHTRTNFHDIPANWIADLPTKRNHAGLESSSRHEYGGETTKTATKTRRPLPWESIDNFARGLSRVAAVDPMTVQMSAIRDCLYSDSQLAQSEGARTLRQKLKYSVDPLPGGHPELFISLSGISEGSLTEWFALASKYPGSPAVLHGANRIFYDRTQSEIGLSDQILFEHDVMFTSIYNKTMCMPWKDSMISALLNCHKHDNISFSSDDSRDIPKLIYLYVNKKFNPKPSNPQPGLERNKLKHVINLGEAYEEKFNFDIALHIYSFAVSRIERSSRNKPDKEDGIPTAHKKCARIYIYKGYAQEVINMVIQGRKCLIQDSIDNPRGNSNIFQTVIEIFYDAVRAVDWDLVHRDTGRMIKHMLSWFDINQVNISAEFTDFIVHLAKLRYMWGDDFLTIGEILTEHGEHRIAAAVYQNGAYHQYKNHNSTDKFTYRAAKNYIYLEEFEISLSVLKTYENWSAEYESSFQRLAEILRNEHSLMSFEKAIADISEKRDTYASNREEWESFLQKYIGFLIERRGSDEVLYYLSRPDTPNEVVKYIISSHATAGFNFRQEHLSSW